MLSQSWQVSRKCNTITGWPCAIKREQERQRFLCTKSEAINLLSSYLSVYHVTYWQTATLELSAFNLLYIAVEERIRKFQSMQLPEETVPSVRMLDRPFISDLTRSTAFGSCRSYCLLQSSTSMRMYLSSGEIGTILTSIYWTCSGSGTSYVFPPVFSRLDNL